MLTVVAEPTRLVRTTRHAGRAATREDDSLLVRVWDARAAGLGEATPFPGVSRDGAFEGLPSLPTTLRAPGSLEDVADLVATLPPAHAATRFALETALLGWLAAARGVLPVRLFPGASPVGVSALVSVEDGIGRARELLAQGAKTLKVKAAADEIDAAVALAETLRREVARPFHLRFDWNRALDVGAARRALADLARFDVELVEEPSKDPSALGPTAVPWALDESLLDADLRARLGSLGASAVVLKPTVLGGLSACRTIASAAMRAGLRRIVTHAFEGPTALAAVNLLAVSLPGVLDSGLTPPRPGWIVRPEDL